MKKIIIMIAMFFAITNSSFTQSVTSDNREKLIVGPKLGLNYSNIYDSKDEDFDADAKAGIVFGGFVSIPIGKYFGLQPELLFSQKGFKGSGKYLGIEYDLSRTVSYLDIPILFAVKPAEFVTLLIGPQFSYLLKQNDEFNNSIQNITREEDFENDNLRKNLFCFLAGADVNLNQFVIGARGGWDLTQNHGDGSSSTPRYKNVWLQLTVGYRLFID